MRKELSPRENLVLTIVGAIVVLIIFALLSFQSGGIWDAIWVSAPIVSIYFGYAYVLLQRALRSRKGNVQVITESSSWKKVILCYGIGLLILAVIIIAIIYFNNPGLVSIGGLFAGPFLGAATVFLHEALDARRKARPTAKQNDENVRRVK